MIFMYQALGVYNVYVYLYTQMYYTSYEHGGCYLYMLHTYVYMYILCVYTKCTSHIDPAHFNILYKHFEA